MDKLYELMFQYVIPLMSSTEQLLKHKDESPLLTINEITVVHQDKMNLLFLLSGLAFIILLILVIVSRLVNKVVSYIFFVLSFLNLVFMIFLAIHSSIFFRDDVDRYSKDFLRQITVSDETSIRTDLQFKDGLMVSRNGNDPKRNVELNRVSLTADDLIVETDSAENTYGIEDYEIRRGDKLVTLEEFDSLRDMTKIQSIQIIDRTVTYQIPNKDEATDALRVAIIKLKEK